MDDLTKLGGVKAAKIIGVHTRTLYNWERDGKIKAIRSGPLKRRLYNVKDFMENNKEYKDEYNKYYNRINICYCRVSSNRQKDDLERQVKYMKSKYPKHEIIKDIGSGLNFKRKGLQKIIKIAINGNLGELIVAYKDRLCRFGFDLIYHLIKTYSNGKIKIENEKDLSPNEELMDDMLEVMNVFVAKRNGLRKYNITNKKQ
jgi:predicted site-specific integrase-resolvase